MLINLGLRNLLRQKRRNMMLGIAISIGVMILVTASSFSRGIKDIMFNKIITFVSGHVGVNVNEGSGRKMPVFRDRERLIGIVKSSLPAESDVNESMAVFARAIGNGKADNMILAGIDLEIKVTDERKKSYEESFNLLEGRFEDLASNEFSNPVILSKDRADSLNVRKKDVISIRFRNILGQNQSERLTVVGILGNDNIFMQGVMFCELNRLKSMMGYLPHETANIRIKLKRPERNAVKVADRLHSALKPGPAFIAGKIPSPSGEHAVTVIPFMGDQKSLEIIKSTFRLSSGKITNVLKSDGAMASSGLASKLGLLPGSSLTVIYNPKFIKGTASFKIKVSGIFTPDGGKGDDVIYIHESLFYPKFYDAIPDLERDINSASLPSGDKTFTRALGTEWTLLDRSRNSDEMRKKNSAQSRKKTHAASIDVNSMYEGASDVLKLESVLNIITLTSVLVLFFIILIGVVNTLRMTIKERTREIGTIRALGMQKKDVRGIFIVETTLLALFASMAGTIFALVLMSVLSLPEFSVTDNPMGILLVNRHLYFMPTPGGIISNVILILIITFITAYFPAKRAANLSAAEALRHYE